MASYEYLVLLGLCVLATLPLELVLGVRVYRQPVRLMLALACMAAVFVTWDVVGARLKHWAYNPDAITGLRFVQRPACGR